MNFKQFLNVNEYYVGFVNENDKYDKLGLNNLGADYYLGEYKNGTREGYGILYAKGIGASFGRISYNAINGLGVLANDTELEFGYFYNGIFETGFIINEENKLSFKSKAHQSFLLSLDKAQKNYKFILIKNNPDFTKEIIEGKNEYIIKNYEKTMEAMKKKGSNGIILKHGIVGKKDNFYGHLINNNPGNYGIILNEKNNNYKIYSDTDELAKNDNLIEIIKDGKLFLHLYENDKAKGKLSYENYELEIKKDMFIINIKNEEENQKIIIDGDLNILSQRIEDEVSVGYKKESFKLDDKKNYEYNQNIEKELDRLIGLKKAKEQLKRIISYVVKNKENDLNLHMAFLGNPGTGKTTFAKLIADLFYKHGILPTPKFVNGNRSTLVARYVGHTAPKTRKAIDDAMGGVLLIDEAYSLIDKGEKKSFGTEAINTLIQEMENNRGKFCCILAGYKKEMLELFNTNPGFKSRIQFIIDFEDFTMKELELIINDLLREAKLKISRTVNDKIISIIAYMKKSEYFGNARDCRNLIEQLNMIALDRDDFNGEITLDDIAIYMKENTLFEKRIKKSKMINYNSLQISSDRSLFIDAKDSVISLFHTYDNENINSTGVVISKDGYALTLNLKIEDCISSKALRYTSDMYGNKIEIINNVSYANNDRIVIIKLDNEGANLPFATIAKLSNEELLKKNLYAIGIWVEKKEKARIIMDVKLYLDENNIKVKTNDKGMFLDGTAIFDLDNNLVGLMDINGNFINANELLKTIEKYQ